MLEHDLRLDVELTPDSLCPISVTASCLCGWKGKQFFGKEAYVYAASDYNNHLITEQDRIEREARKHTPYEVYRVYLQHAITHYINTNYDFDKDSIHSAVMKELKQAIDEGRTIQIKED